MENCVVILEVCPHCEEINLMPMSILNENEEILLVCGNCAELIEKA